jgi:chitinase
MMYKQYITCFSVFAFLMTQVAPVHAAMLVGAKEQARLDAQKAKQTTVAEGRWLMAYYVGYQHSYLKPKDVEYGLMTHIVVGSVGVNSDGTLNAHFNRQNGEGIEMAKDVAKRAKAKGVRPLIWLAGPHEEDKLKSASSDQYRAAFVKNIIALLDELGYEGVDIDWEPIRKEDEPGILALVKDLRAARPDMLITVPVNWIPSTLVPTKNLSLYKNLAKYTDRLFVMSYSMAGPWAGWRVWHGSALEGETATTPSSVQSSIDAYLAAGVPKEQLGIGVGTYATCWEYKAKTPGKSLPANYSSSKVKTMSMRTMFDDYYTKKAEKWDEAAKVPYLTFSKARGKMKCGFISYENEQSVSEKMKYVQEAGLGGALVWNLGTGYFPEESKSRRNPLLQAAFKAL